MFTSAAQQSADRVQRVVLVPAPGPGLNYGLTFRPWLSENPNGAWNIFVMDSNAADSGSIAGGWSMSFNVSAVPEPSVVILSSLALSAIVLRKRREVRAISD